MPVNTAMIKLPLILLFCLKLWRKIFRKYNLLLIIYDIDFILYSTLKNPEKTIGQNSMAKTTLSIRRVSDIADLLRAEG